MSEPHRRIYLVRHGATDANLQHPYVLQGQRTDLPLAELGRRQAEAVASVLASRQLAHVFSSPMRRAVETATVIAAPHNLSVQPVAELSECDVGRWEALSWETIRLQDHEAWSAFEAHPGTAPYAGGESFEQVQARAVPAIDRLLREHPRGDLVIVTHNVVARVYLARVTKTPIDQARAIRVDNGAISVVLAAEGKQKLLTLNSAFHLQGLLVE